MFRKYLATSSWLAIACWLSCCVPAARGAELLTIGSDAPAIDVEHWVQDGKGKFKPVTEFANGKVYVVEFWATWCGPCVQSMPHLAQLQTDYANKGVQIVSISDEELETVEKFLEREVQGVKRKEEKGQDDKPQTYKDLTSAYCLTTDPDRSVHTSYMEAAGQNGIPTAFIVGKDGKIEWIGHPMEMDKPLSEIVAGKWDRDAFAEEFKEQQEFSLMMAKLSAVMRKGDTQAALTILEEAIAKAKKEPIKTQLGIYRLQVQLNDKASQKQLPTIAAEAYKTYEQQVQVINMVAWTVAQRMEAGELEDKSLLESTRTAIEKAAKQGDGDERASVLDTAAHVQELAGDLNAAIKSQTTAVELASPRLKSQLQEYLDALKKKKSAGDKPDTPEKPAK